MNRLDTSHPIDKTIEFVYFSSSVPQHLELERQWHLQTGVDINDSIRE